MITKVRLVKRTERRWLGNGMGGYEPCSYDMVYGTWTVATVEARGPMRWCVSEGDEGPVHHFWRLADVRAWGNERIRDQSPAHGKPCT